MNDKLLLTFNAGSSTIKIGLFTVEDGSLRQTGRGKIDFRETPLRLELSDGPDRLDIILEAEQDEELDTVISETFSRLARHYDLSNVVAIGHRVVHGGDIFDGPVFVDDKTIIQMQALVPLAPLHQSQAMHLIHAIRRLRPNIPQTASFDTAFHRTNADIVRRFALPRALHDKGIKRYGFHGLSYKFIAGALTREWPMEAAGKVVVAHMGSGVSLCALDSCVSRDTSMGFSTLDGVPMATRCGTLDAGVVLHLARNGESVGQLETLLYHKSGLLGVSGISGDTRVLLDSEKEEAREALELFTLRIAGEIARLAATLGGLTIHGRITSPGHYIALLEAPLTMRIDPEREVTLNWQTARASFRGGAAGFSELSVEVIQPVAMVGKGDTPDERVSAKDFSVHLRRSPGDKPGSDFVFRLGDVTHPFIDRFVGSPEPMTLELQATAPGLLLDPTRRIEESLEAWRLARGQARVVLAKATKGQALVDLSGVLGLDAERRLEGNLQGRARGIDQMVSGVTRRMGIQLSGLLGRLGGGQGMPIALVFENGRMRFGPFPLAQLDPLY